MAVTVTDTRGFARQRMCERTNLAEQSNAFAAKHLFSTDEHGFSRMIKEGQ